MDFEQALCAELKSIPGILKVSPLYVPEVEKPPYLVYRNSSVTYKKTLNGTTLRRTSTYDLFLITKKYDDLKSLADSVTMKAISFLGREIGTGGPLILDVTVIHNGDRYEPEVDTLRSDISITVTY